MAESKAKGSGLLERDRSVLVVIDVQERYMPHLREPRRLLEAVRRLILGAQEVGVPLLLTEQYPQGLGPTNSDLLEVLDPPVTPIEKRTMSCLSEPAFVKELESLNRDQIVIAGIEGHACVHQTVHEALSGGYETHVVVDAIDSRFPRDCEVALERAARAGATQTTVESVLLEWVRTADAPEFQAVRSLIRDPLPEG